MFYSVPVGQGMDHTSRFNRQDSHSLGPHPEHRRSTSGYLGGGVSACRFGFRRQGDQPFAASFTPPEACPAKVAPGDWVAPHPPRWGWGQTREILVRGDCPGMDKRLRSFQAPGLSDWAYRCPEASREWPAGGFQAGPVARPLGVSMAIEGSPRGVDRQKLAEAIWIMVSVSFKGPDW